MDFRSHLGRRIDLRHRSNLVLAVIVALAGVAAAVLWISGEPGTVLWAPVHAFLIWALLREIDPDHQWSAIVGAVVAGVWVLNGLAITSVWAPGGLILAARIATSTTGRRLLPVDLGVVSAFGIAIGFTVQGWAAGFGMALALYLDDRFRGENRLPAIAAAAIAAVGTTVVASAAGAFPDTVPDIIPYLAIVAGVAALVMLVREPAEPTSRVDARHAAFIDRVRLHVSRSIIGLLVFLMTILTGADAEGMVIVIAALWLAILSNEIELLRRRRR
jgi:hypothetical protein